MNIICIYESISSSFKCFGRELQRDLLWRNFWGSRELALGHIFFQGMKGILPKNGFSLEVGQIHQHSGGFEYVMWIKMFTLKPWGYMFLRRGLKPPSTMAMQMYGNFECLHLKQVHVFGVLYKFHDPLLIWFMICFFVFVESYNNMQQRPERLPRAP